jgi:hypothetical protein
MVTVAVNVFAFHYGSGSQARIVTFDFSDGRRCGRINGFATMMAALTTSVVALETPAVSRALRGQIAAWLSRGCHDLAAAVPLLADLLH